MRGIEENREHPMLTGIRQLPLAFLKDPQKVGPHILALLFVGVIKWELKMYWKFWKRYGWKGVGVVVGILALLIVLQPTGIGTVIGNAWFLWMPLLLLFALLWAGRKFSHSHSAEAATQSADPGDEPASGVFFGTGEPERTRWGGEKN